MRQRAHLMLQYLGCRFNPIGRVGLLTLLASRTRAAFSGFVRVAPRLEFAWKTSGHWLVNPITPYTH